MNKKAQKFLLIFTLIILDNFSLSFTAKLDKKHDKHKPANAQNQPKKENQLSHKNSTSLHHSNHTSGLGQLAGTQAPPPHVGWSLDKNEAQQHHNNPNGYVLHHHEGGGHGQHGHQTHQSHHEGVNSQQQQHQPIQHQATHNQPEQSSGIGSAVAAGVGGLALGEKRKFITNFLNY